MRIILMLITIFISVSANYITSEDNKNYYLESQHFKVIVGIEYKLDTNIQDKMTNILDIAEKSWDVEINQLGFNAPRNTQSSLIDIYIGNMNAYNYEYDYFQEIDASFAGWASSYSSNNTPFFVLSDTINDDILKTTISHEFFHTIQYSYFEISNIDYDKWIKNIWWFEATAVLLEDEVYDDLNGYVYFANQYFNNTDLAIETYNRSHEYSLVVFAKYIKERFGFDIIKKSLSMIETSGELGFFEILDNIFKDDYNTSMIGELTHFTLWLKDPSLYFEEGNLYNNVKKFDTDTNSELAKGAIKILNNSRILLDSGVYVTFDVESGWNFVGTPDNISSSKLNIQNEEYAWIYQNNTWEYFSKSKIGNILAGSAIWLYKKDKNLISFESNILGEDSSVNVGWNMISPVSGDIDVVERFKVKSNYQAAFSYKNEKWNVYAPNFDTSAFETLDIVKVSQGAWIKSIENTVSDNFNLVLDIEVGDYSNFKIGIRFNKLATGAYGEIIINKDIIHITGTKSDGTNASKTYNIGTDVYDSMLNFDGDKLSLNLDDVFEIQDMVPASTFKAISKYDIFVYSDNVNFTNSTTINEKVELTNYSFSTDYQFDVGSNIIKREVEIK